MLRDHHAVRIRQPVSNHHHVVLLPHERGERGSLRLRLQPPRQRVLRRRSPQEVPQDHAAVEEEDEKRGNTSVEEDPAQFERGRFGERSPDDQDEIGLQIRRNISRS